MKITPFFDIISRPSSFSNRFQVDLYPLNMSAISNGNQSVEAIADTSSDSGVLADVSVDYGSQADTSSDSRASVNSRGTMVRILFIHT